MRDRELKKKGTQESENIRNREKLHKTVRSQRGKVYPLNRNRMKMKMKMKMTTGKRAPETENDSKNLKLSRWVEGQSQGNF